MALSYASPIVPIEPTSPASRTLVVNAQGAKLSEFNQTLQHLLVELSVLVNWMLLLGRRASPSQKPGSRLMRASTESCVT